MAIKPILFHTEMVRAILEGRKSCTRRLVKPQPDGKHTFPLGFVTDSTEKKEVGCFGFGIDECGGSIKYVKPPYQPGDILYVRETWMDYAGLTMYKADCDKYKLESLNFAGFGWHPSIHMPKEAARIWLKVTDVRVERLREITEAQAKAEGIRGYSKDGNLYKYAVTDDWWIDYHNKIENRFLVVLGGRICLELQRMRFRIFGTVPSRNLTLTAMVGMQIRGCGLSNLSDVISRKVRNKDEWVN